MMFREKSMNDDEIRSTCTREIIQEKYIARSQLLERPESSVVQKSIIRYCRF